LPASAPPCVLARATVLPVPALASAKLPPAPTVTVSPATTPVKRICAVDTVAAVEPS